MVGTDDMKEGTKSTAEPDMPALGWGTQDGCEHKCLCLCSDGVEGAEKGRGLPTPGRLSVGKGREFITIREMRGEGLH